MGSIVSELFASFMFKVGESIFYLKMFVSASKSPILCDITYHSQ